jgi:hypothetical protein
MKSWRKAVIALLRAALRAGQLRAELTVDQMEDLLTHFEKCWWSVKVQSFKSKEHFLRYAARYARRPPIAQRRITCIEERKITFWTKDKKLDCRVEVQCTPEEFIDLWGQRIPESYQHAVRSYGLFAPCSLGQTSAVTVGTSVYKCYVGKYEWRPLSCCGDLREGWETVDPVFASQFFRNFVNR